MRVSHPLGSLAVIVLAVGILLLAWALGAAG
jgi:hypothetical protein